MGDLSPSPRPSRRTNGGQIGQDGSRLFETGWGTSKWALNGSGWKQTVPFLYGGGGFTVLNGSPYFGFQRPFYQ